jgi:hypothetical protein
VYSPAKRFQRNDTVQIVTANDNTRCVWSGTYTVSQVSPDQCQGPPWDTTTQSCALTLTAFGGGTRLPLGVAAGVTKTHVDSYCRLRRPDGSYTAKADGATASSAGEATQCLPCSAGQTIDQTNGKPDPKLGCKSCAQGKYSIATAAEDCQLCPEGTFSAATAASNKSTCTPCASGKVSARGQQSCGDCEDGKFRIETSLIGEDITRDRWKEYLGDDDCVCAVVSDAQNEVSAGDACYCTCIQCTQRKGLSCTGTSGTTYPYASAGFFLGGYTGDGAMDDGTSTWWW